MTNKQKCPKDCQGHVTGGVPHTCPQPNPEVKHCNKCDGPKNDYWSHACLYPKCECHKLSPASTEEWEKEFEIKYGKKAGRPVDYHERVKSFIRSLLFSHDQQLRQRIVERVNSLPTFRNAKFEIEGGPFSDEKVRGPNIEKVDLINRYAVIKAINNDIDTYDVS